MKRQIYIARGKKPREWSAMNDEPEEKEEELTPFEKWLFDEGVAVAVGPGADPVDAARAAWNAALKSVNDLLPMPETRGTIHVCGRDEG